MGLRADKPTLRSGGAPIRGPPERTHVDAPATPCAARAMEIRPRSRCRPGGQRRRCADTSAWGPHQGICRYMPILLFTGGVWVDRRSCFCDLSIAATSLSKFNFKTLQIKSPSPGPNKSFGPHAHAGIAVRGRWSFGFRV